MDKLQDWRIDQSQFPIESKLSMTAVTETSSIEGKRLTALRVDMRGCRISLRLGILNPTTVDPQMRNETFRDSSSALELEYQEKVNVEDTSE